MHQFLDGYANYSNEEYFRMFGTLSRERIEYLLELEDSVPDKAVYNAYCQEAMGQFMEEDFLSEEIRKLQEFSKRIRGENRETLKEIISKIEDAVQSQVHSSEYGIEQLEKVLNSLKENP